MCMSIHSSLLLAFMQLAGLKKKLTRRSFEELNRMGLPNPPAGITKHHTTEKIDIGGSLGYWIGRERATQGVLVYLHGGGYTFGPIDFQWEYIAHLSLRAGMAAIVIDYRQLPRYPFPTGLNDVVTILTTLQQSSELSGRWFLIGDSAGGGLALATSYRLREIGASQPHKIILLSPWLDVGMKNTDSIVDDPVISPELVRNIAEAYTAGNDVSHPLISPLYGDITGLPPVLLQTGTRELLLSGCRAFYQKCREAGVDIHYEEYPGMFHVFAIMNFLPEAQKAQQVQLSFIADHKNS
jgi:monoterpene epsilon-lactone hydrolase